MNAQMYEPSEPHKIRILYADDRSANVRSLLEGVKAAGLLSEHLKEHLVLYQLDLDENQKHNHELLHHPDCLVELDYATLMSEPIEKVRSGEQTYDLIISDWYYGEYDPDSKDSQIGGIWIMLWGQHRNKEFIPVCKLYTGQLDTEKQQRIDFILAKGYIKTVFGIEVSEIRKSETAASWQQHLEEYLQEVAKNKIQHAKRNDVVAVINHIADRLTFSRFNNSIEDDVFETFRQDLLRLDSFSLRLPGGKSMRLAHLFPLLLGRYLRGEATSAFATMSHKEIAALLFAQSLYFYKRDARNEKIKNLRQLGVVCEEIKKHDGTGNPLYGIQVKSESYYEGPLATITNLLTQSLDFTFKVQSFYLNESGFYKWLHSRNVQVEREGFGDNRKHTIISEFEKLKSCFDRTPMELNSALQALGDQIAEVLSKLDADDVQQEAKDCSEKSLDEKFARLQRQPLIERKSKKLLLPIENLFRINVHDFLANIGRPGQISEFEDIDDEYEPIGSRDLYWYCHAWLVREGLRAIVNNMQSHAGFFILLKPRNIAATPFVRYKIILRDNGKGLGSIARAFVAKGGHLASAAKHLQGFCEMMVRSKMEGEEGIEYDVYSETTDEPCLKMGKTGTEFEIIFTQRRDR